MDTTTYSVRLPNDLHHRLKLHALNCRTHASDIVRAILEDSLPPLPGPVPIDPQQTVIAFPSPPAPDPAIEAAMAAHPAGTGLPAATNEADGEKPW